MLQGVATSSAPRITVLMPVYNGARYLRAAMDSILAQTFRDFELLIIDDGSTDGSRDLAESHGDPRIRVVSNPGNLGLVPTLNQGLELARGDYVARMDCDDIALPERLERQVAFMDRNGEVGLCGTFYEWFDGRSAKTVQVAEDDESLRQMLAIENPFGHFTVMLRRRPLEDLGLRYDAAFRHAEDYAFWLRCSRHMKLANIPEALVRYRCHEDSTSSLHRTAQMEAADRVRRMQLDFLGIAATPEELQIHRDLCEHRFSGGEADLRAAAGWLDKLAAHLDQGGGRSRFVQQKLGTNWYLACGRAAGLGLNAWRLFRSCRAGRNADTTRYAAKLLLRCLLRHPVPPATAVR